MSKLYFHKRLVKRLAQTRYVKKAIQDRADLSEFKKRPDLRIILGISAIALSYLICWPAISAAASLSLWLKQPWIAIICSPLIYGLSHLTFILGMYLAGEKYSRIFMRWAARVAVEKLMRISGLEEDILS